MLTTDDGHAKDPYAVRRVCAELSRLVLANNALRLQMIADELLLPRLVAAVAEHVDAQDLVLADCCRFLRRTINLRGAVVSVSAFILPLKYQQLISVLFVGVCLQVPSPELDIQTRIVETGILKLLVQGLKCHPHSKALFSEACRLTTLLCFDLPFAPHGMYFAGLF